MVLVYAIKASILPVEHAQICSAFVDTPDCERHIEQMVCAVTCFPGAHGTRGMPGSSRQTQLRGSAGPVHAYLLHQSASSTKASVSASCFPVA